MMAGIDQKQEASTPRVVVVSLASCFGCQVQITNMEAHLLDVIGQIDLGYWQLASSGEMPADYDIAIIEGAVTTEESLAVVKDIREKAKKVILIGACANTGGVPGMAASGFAGRAAEVYGDIPQVCEDMIAPRSVASAIPVDYRVPSCPIDPEEFVDVLVRALYGSNKAISTKTMCGDCKRNESVCFYNEGTLCLGMVTLAGCGARCVSYGRPCNGCRGLSPDANLASARDAVVRLGADVGEFDKALEMFNQNAPACGLEG